MNVTMGENTQASLAAVLDADDPEELRALLAKLLKADIAGLRLEQTAGERFTGGRSTPVWKLYFTAARGERKKDTQLVIKRLNCAKPPPGVRAEDRMLSYSNERAFYLQAGAAAREVCRIPRLLFSESTKEGASFLLEDLSLEYPLHPESVDGARVRGALRWLANFHARFWEADAGGGHFPEGLWAAGDFWGIAKRDNEAKLDKIADNFAASAKVLKTHGAFDELRTFGQRLAAAARALDTALRKPRGFVKNRTLLHGDFKTANMFLRPIDDGNSEAAVVDFEFTGPGLVAVDLAYFLFPDARMDLLGEEAELLRFYHAALEASLDERGAGLGLSLAELEVQYDAARCDFLRHMVARGWAAFSASDVEVMKRAGAYFHKLDGGRVLLPAEYEQAIVASFCV